MMQGSLKKKLTAILLLSIFKKLPKIFFRHRSLKVWMCVIGFSDYFDFI
jgi:hypothetical protein